MNSESRENTKKIEVTHVNVRTSIFFLLLRLVLVDIIAAALTLFFFAFMVSPEISEGIKLQILSRNFAYFIIFVILKVTLTIYVVLAWLNEYYEITPEIIYHRRGIIFEDESKYRLDNIRVVKLIQGISGRFLNFGTLELYDIRLNKRMGFYLIHNPRRYLRILKSIIPKLEEEKEVLRMKSEGFDD